MMIGYARTSTADQVAGLVDQVCDLKAAGCEKVYQEHASGKNGERPQLVAVLDFAREGDTLIVTKLDRLARSTLDLWKTVEHLQSRGVGLNILAMGLDTSTATGKLMLGVLGAVAQFEREVMLERQRAGIDAAMAAGKYKGRAPTAQRQSEAVMQLRRAGVAPAEIARKVGISRASVYRIIGPAPRQLELPEAAD